MSYNASSQDLKFVQIKCPSCGYNITQLTPFKSTVECPYCHKEYLNPIIVEKSERVPDRVIPFTTTEEDFADAMLQSFIDESYLPLELFKEVTFGKVIKAFLPKYLFIGNFDASWNCHEIYYVNQKYRQRGQTRTRRIRKTRYVHGTADGNFEVSSLAYVGEEAPVELLNFSDHTLFSLEDSFDFAPELLELQDDKNILTLELNCDPSQIWYKSGNKRATREAQRTCLAQAPRSKERFRFSAKIRLEQEPIYVMQPFWFVYFFYKGQKYHFIMDGSGKYKNVKAPQDGRLVVRRFLPGTILGIIPGVVYACLHQDNFLYISICATIVFALLYFGDVYISKQKRIEAAKKAFPNSKLFQENTH